MPKNVRKKSGQKVAPASKVEKVDTKRKLKSNIKTPEKLASDNELRASTRIKRLSKTSDVQGKSVKTRKRKRTSTNSCRKVIIDTDPGTDDAVTILMLLEDPKIEVIALTITQGNATLQNTSRNALRILNAAQRNDIPVYEGADTSILNKKVRCDNYYGDDGMGDTTTDYDKNLSKPQIEKATSALIRMANENMGEITLVCIGPLTNVALALRLDNRFCSKLKECYIMGGNYTGRGNITPAAEFNFYRDPEAAYIVLKEMKCPIVLIPWELCLTLDLSWDWYNKITNRNTRYSKFLKVIGKKMLENAMNAGIESFVPADELVAACLINEDMIMEEECIVCEVELGGHMTRGQVVVNWKESEKSGVNMNMKVIKKIDSQKFKVLMEGLISTKCSAGSQA